MEYLGRLGLVPRKSKKAREESLQKRKCGEESRALKKDFTRAIESGLTSKKVADYPRHSTAIIDIPRHSLPTSTASSHTPGRTSSASVIQDGASFAEDMEYYAYERHVQAQARARDALFGAPGGRHAWKTLIFWKRRRTAAPARSISLGPVLPLVSAATPPVTYRRGGLQTPNRTPNRNGPWRHYHRQSTGCNNGAVPLYCSDDFDSMSIRAWYEPMLRRGNVVSSEACNRSPYVHLGGRRTPRVPSSPGPLYLV